MEHRQKHPVEYVCLERFQGLAITPEIEETRFQSSENAIEHPVCWLPELSQGYKAYLKVKSPILLENLIMSTHLWKSSPKTKVLEEVPPHLKSLKPI